MAASEALVERVRRALATRDDVEEKKMFRGITFMVDGKMCVSVSANRLMCRIDPAIQDEELQHDGTKSVIMRGHEYKGFVYVDEEALANRKDLDYWKSLCLEYNARAKASRKRK